MTTQNWLCTVCGYIHHGEDCADCCPVCGAGAERFNLQTEQSPATPQPAPNEWRCLNCDYIATGDSPPTLCPLCGVGADRFAPHHSETQTATLRVTPDKIVIAGAGISGISAAEAVRKSAPDTAITVITREAELPYYRLNLTRYLAGEIAAEDLPIHPESWYTEHRIELLRSTEIRTIDRANRTLHLKEQGTLNYDKLILALGAHPFVPAVAGINRENIIALRTRKDADTILAHCRKGTNCTVVGGGVLGLETAAALAQRGANVRILEGFGWLLPRQLNRTAGERLATTVQALGIELVCHAQIKQFDGDELVRSVRLESDQSFPAELVVIATGVRGNSYLARLAELEVNNGVVVDNRLCTSDPDIFAVGDLAEHQGVSYGTWAPAQFQGTISGMNAAGGTLDFAGIPRSNILKILDVDLFSIGHVHPDDGSYRTFEDDGEDYRYLVFRDTHLVGAILLGDTSLASQLKELIETKTCCAELLMRASSAKDIFELISAAH